MRRFPARRSRNFVQPIARVELLARESAQADSPILDLVAFHQVCPQAVLCMRLQLLQYLAGVSIMEVVHPPAKAGIHATKISSSGIGVRSRPVICVIRSLIFARDFGAGQICV